MSLSLTSASALRASADKLTSFFTQLTKLTNWNLPFNPTWQSRLFFKNLTAKKVKWRYYVCLSWYKRRRSAPPRQAHLLLQNKFDNWTRQSKNEFRPTAKLPKDGTQRQRGETAAFALTRLQIAAVFFRLCIVCVCFLPFFPFREAQFSTGLA